MISKPVPVPKKEITSVDIVGWASGLNLNGAQFAPPSSFIDSKDVELSIDGFLVPRRTLTPFLPDNDGVVFQILPVLWSGSMYYFTLDNGKARFCQEGDSDWTDCGGTNSFTTNAGGKPELLRVLDNVLILNGDNGDKLSYIDLSTGGFPVVKYTPVTDPTTVLTATPTNLTNSGSFKVYYAYSYTSSVGETKLNTILDYTVNIDRDHWGDVPASLGSIKLTRPDFGAEPAGAQFWNLYIALASTGGSIQDTDMLRLATKLDIAVGSFTDDGTLSINLGAVAPVDNSTDAFKVSHGIVEDGNPILFGDVDNPENIYLGGGGPYAMDFSISDGGYVSQPEKGTNFHVTAIIGFRNGQGIPSLTVLFSNTEGLSKQSVLQQENVTYGNQTFSVWSVTSQHYGAAGVAATNSAINYQGKLLFLSTDGFMSMNTQPLRQNVIATDPISVQSIDAYVRAIKNSAMKNVVGAGWDNKYMWIIPNNGFDDPQQILVADDNNQVQNHSAWYTMDIPANWIGVVSPIGDPAFVYVTQNNRSYKLAPGRATFDTKGGVPVPFSTKATGPLLSMGGSGHNHWRAIVQVMFQVLGLVGDITVGVTYRNQNNTLKTKTKTFHGPVYTPSGAGGWGDPMWDYSGMPLIPGYSPSPASSAGTAVVEAVDVRIPIQIDDIANEAQWFYTTPVGYGKYKVRAVSFEGIDLGVRPDLQ